MTIFAAAALVMIYSNCSCVPALLLAFIERERGGRGRRERGEGGREERGEWRGERGESREDRGERREERGEGRGERGERRGERGEGREERVQRVFFSLHFPTSLFLRHTR
jgi:hypothetical protein